MESEFINCKKCASHTKEHSAGTCCLCGALHCDECLNEAGYCTPCSEKMSYSKDEAIPV